MHTQSLTRHQKQTVFERVDCADSALIPLSHPPSPLAGLPYLDKFAVDRMSQGEKLGEQLWSGLTQFERSFCWRSRASNRTNGWYFNKSDGCWRVDGAGGIEWCVFWRGLDKEQVELALEMVPQLPSTFTS